MHFNVRVAKLLGVAVLYAFGGVLCEYLQQRQHQFTGYWGPNSDLLDLSLGALPFVVLSVALFLRTWKAVLSAPLNIAVWALTSTFAADFGRTHAGDIRSVWVGLCLAGLAGGLGVALADSICHPILLAPRYLAGAACIGTVAGVPFGLWCFGFVTFVGAWMCALVIWQASMGTYLYSACTHGKMANSQKGRQV